jgi:polyferredoxin
VDKLGCLESCLEFVEKKRNKHQSEEEWNQKKNKKSIVSAFFFFFFFFFFFPHFVSDVSTLVVSVCGVFVNGNVEIKMSDNEGDRNAVATSRGDDEEARAVAARG